MITPTNNHVLIQPLARNAGGVMRTSEKNYDEKGIVLSELSANEVDLKGKIVYFDAWQAAKYNEDTADEFWLVPSEAIRAYE